MELSSRILRKFSGAGLAKASVKELKNTFGLGSAKASEIVACYELVADTCKTNNQFCFYRQKTFGMNLRIFAIIKEHFVIFFLIQEIKKLNAR